MSAKMYLTRYIALFLTLTAKKQRVEVIKNVGQTCMRPKRDM